MYSLEIVQFTEKMDEDDFETGDFIPDENEGDFKTPLGENEDAASDDDGPQPKRFRSDSESTTASGMISYEYFIICREGDSMIFIFSVSTSQRVFLR